MNAPEIEELGQAISELFPAEAEGCTNDNELVKLAIRKLKDYAAMSVDVYEGIKMTELYGENSFLIGQWHHLENMEQTLALKLKSAPGDILILGKMARVQHDLDLIRTKSNEVNQKLMDATEILAGKKFKYLPTTENAKRNAK